MFSANYEAALVFAAQAHRQQLRKGTTIPYLTHTVHVSVILLRYGFAEEVVIAGLLHDVLEDCGVTRETLAANFGAKVADLVVAVSKPAGDLSWEASRAALLAQVEVAGQAAAALKAADTLHNVQSLLHDLKQEGPTVWQRFKRGKPAFVGYYQAVGAQAEKKLGDHPLVAELAIAVAELAASVEEPYP